MRREIVNGSFYTPPHIVRLIVENTIGRLCDGLRADALPDFRILDPSCGEGAFLSGARDYLLERFPSEKQDSAFDHCLCGVDLDASALARAKQSLPGAKLVCGDSLLGPMDWTREFPDAAARSGFDAVIGNPPWTSLTGRFGKQAYSAGDIRRLRERYGGNSYMPNVFEYFVARGLELTRHGGYFSFIVPDRLASNAQFADLRRRLLARAELLLLAYGIPFPGVAADTMVFVVRKTPPSPESEVEAREYKGLVSRHPTSAVVASPGGEFPRAEDPEVSRLVRLMEEASGGIALGSVCQSASGFGGRSALITPERVSEAQIPVLKGASIARYAVRKTFWFEFRRQNLTGRTADTGKLSASPKILIRKTGNRLIAAYDESGAFPEQSLYFLFDKREGVDWRFVLGVLNSEAASIYYRARCLTNTRTMAHAKKTDLDRLPLPKLDLAREDHKARHDRICALVDDMLELHRRLANSARSEMIRKEIAEHDAEINGLVCESYGLAQAE